MIITAIWLCIVKISPPQSSSPSRFIQPTEVLTTPTPEPSVTPSPTLVPPKPTRAVTAPTKSVDADNGESKNCTALKNGGPSIITIELQPRSGQMTGDTVIRLKQGGSCPGPSTSEQWISSGERQKTFDSVQPGTYLIEVANGNYQGVIRQTVTVAGRNKYLFTVPIND